MPVLMKSLHADGYKIVIFGNRSGIKGALTGKNAQKTHSLVNWIASLVPGVPLHGLFATRKNDGKHEGARFFKPNIGMWEAMEQLVNDKVKVDPAASFYVGDMAGREGDPGSSDKEWAANVGASRGVTMRFQTPEEYFGPSAGDNSLGGGGGGGSSGGGGGGDVTIPNTSMLARAALLGGYLHGPRIIVLCGPQGAGKSHFCEALLSPPQSQQQAATSNGPAAGGVYHLSDSDEDEPPPAPAPAPSAVANNNNASVASWVVTCQDTVNNGKPGKRDQCEEAVRQAVRQGKCVIVDRMHLSVDQRAYFLKIGAELGVPVDAVLLAPPLYEMQRRVRERTDHPGGIQGEKGVAFVGESYKKMVVPSHSEGFELVTRCETPSKVSWLTSLYKCTAKAKDAAAAVGTPPWPQQFELTSGPASRTTLLHFRASRSGRWSSRRITLPSCSPRTSSERLTPPLATTTSRTLVRTSPRASISQSKCHTSLRVAPPFVPQSRIAYEASDVPSASYSCCTGPRIRLKRARFPRFGPQWRRALLMVRRRLSASATLR